MAAARMSAAPPAQAETRALAEADQHRTGEAHRDPHPSPGAEPLPEKYRGSKRSPDRAGLYQDRRPSPDVPRESPLRLPVAACRDMG